MITLAQINQQTKASPEAIFAILADVNHWTDFHEGIEWAKLSESFVAGNHFIIKPKGGPKAKVAIQVAEPGKRFLGVSRLIGAKLSSDHRIERHAGKTILKITITIDGPLDWLWAKVLGKNQQAVLEKSAVNLIAKAEKGR